MKNSRRTQKQGSSETQLPAHISELMLRIYWIGQKTWQGRPSQQFRIGLYNKQLSCFLLIDWTPCYLSHNSIHLQSDQQLTKCFSIIPTYLLLSPKRCRKSWDLTLATSFLLQWSLISSLRFECSELNGKYLARIQSLLADQQIIAFFHEEY